jgi:hypothetical protein
MEPLNLKNNIYLHIASLEKIRNCQISNFVLKIVLGAFILLILQACTPALYHVNLKYEPTGTSRKMAKIGHDSPITVAMFNDIRLIDNKRQLGSVITIGGSVIPILPEDMKVSDAITMNIREYFFLSGYRVSNDVPIWDLKKETINKGWGEILVGGNIDELQIVCDDSFPVKTYRTKVTLTFVFADVTKKKIFYRSSIDGSASLEDVSFSEDILNKQINAALSDALEKILNDSVMRKKFEDASKIKPKP